MGEVYLAIQRSLDRQIALKIVRKTLSSREIIERFIREAKFAASIQHPNIVNIYEVGEEEDFFYIAMEYVEGESIENRIINGSLSESATWRIILQVCHALQAALKNGIIHRDIKPANILLTFDNIAKVADFGLSKSTSDNTQLTNDGIILGTPNYMSPEHIEGKSIDYRSDIYSLGASVYHMLTGRILFTGESIIDILYKHKFNKVIPPEEYKTIKNESSLIVAKMLAKTLEHRYLSYSDLISDIEALLSGEPLFFAQVSDAVSLYDISKDTTKRYESGKSSSVNIVSSVMNIFSKTSKIKAPKDFKSFVIVDNVSTKLKSSLPENFPVQINLAGSLVELINCINPNTAGIILNSAFLGVKTIDFLGEIKKTFPEIPIVILLEFIDSISHLKEKDLFISSDLPEKEKAQAIFKAIHNTPFLAKDLNLSHIISLTKSMRWTTKIKLNEGQKNEESILLKNGDITTPGKNIHEESVTELINRTQLWKMEKESFGTNTASYSEISQKIEKKDQSSRDEPTGKIQKEYSIDGDEKNDLIETAQSDSHLLEKDYIQDSEIFKEFKMDIDKLIARDLKEEDKDNIKETEENKHQSSENIESVKEQGSISDLFERLADRAEKEIEKNGNCNF